MDTNHWLCIELVEMEPVIGCQLSSGIAVSRHIGVYNEIATSYLLAKTAVEGKEKYPIKIGGGGFIKKKFKPQINTNLKKV